MTADEKALNEKLTKWVFVYENHPLVFGGPPRKRDGWYHKGEWVCRKYDTPDFFNDFNACLRWLMPKIAHSEIVYHRGSGFSVDVENDVLAGSYAESLPRAFCLAVVKLIDADGSGA